MNVVFIAVDDLRPQLNCYGQEHVKSPNIDKLASTGMLFERAYCMVPTCGASRASLMTGLRPTPRRFVSFTANAQKETPNATTMNSLFKSHGYETVSLGKVFHSPSDNARGWSQKPWGPKLQYGYQSEENRKLHAAGGNKSNKPNRGPPFESYEAADTEYGDGMIASEGIAELARLSGQERPFFLAIGFKKPHLPFVCPKKYWDLYDEESFQLPENYSIPLDVPKGAIHTSGELRSYHGVPNKGPVSDEMARRLIHGYHACVSFTDSQIGRVLDAVHSLGLSDNTIVVLWGDHGWNLGEHSLWCKHSCFETSMHIPLVVRVPNQPAGRCDALIETIDVYPTLCELTGLPRPEHLVGTSFVPQLTDPQTPGKPYAIGRFKDGDTLRSADFRFTEYTDRQGAVQASMLFDHNSDPRENRNLADADSQRQNVKRLGRELNAGKGRD